MPEQDNYKSNYFSIDKKTVTTAKAGFILENVDTTLIDDGTAVAKDRESINKMCTSIPTPFARLFLFKTAFKEIQENEEKQKGTVHRKKGLYNYLVSDCLDMLEFIYYYGSHPNFNVIEWNCQAELEHLNNTGISGHKKISKTLKDHLDADKVLKNINTIYIFTWNDNPEDPKSLPVVVGGTSPYSMVFTSPNWVREKESRGWSFRAGKNGKNLFENDPAHLDPPISLSDRSERFKTFMYKLWFSCTKNIIPSLFHFWKYVEQSWEFYDKNEDFAKLFAGLKSSYTMSDFKEDYPTMLHCIINKDGRLSSSTKDVSVSGDSDTVIEIPIRCQPATALKAHEDYQIRCSKIPMERSGNNASIKIDCPLFLDEEIKVSGALYYEDEPWNNYRKSMPSFNNENPNYWERILPGTNKPYPYLRKEDFLEDKIIGFSGVISNEHFMTGSGGDVFFLPPLKKTFFKFFGIEDLFRLNQDGTFETNNGIPVPKNDLYCITDNGDDTVTVTLKIPIKYNNETITVSKTYYTEDIVFFDDPDAGRIFNMSIFPFYKIIGEEEKYNKYSVMLGHKGNIDLHFYKLDNLNNELHTQKIGNEEKKVVSSRNRTNNKQIDTKYYSVDDSFDIIEVDAGGVKGIVLPLFKRVKLGTNTMVYCVDFGTTNTHIAYAIENGTAEEKAPKDFSYDLKESQVVNLYDVQSYLAYNTTTKREFVPEVIFQDNGNQSVDNNQLSFPIRTTACASSKWLSDNNENTYNLFGDANVGFYFLNEVQNERKDNIYKQNIKWAKGDKVKKLKSAYFDEIMWLLKNKAVMSGCSMNFKFYFTYPQAMEGNDKDDLYKLWKDARKNVKAGNESNNMRQDAKAHPVESIVPWYYHRRKEVEANDVYMNADIGGGTMDIVYYDPNHDENYTYSARFAANDLWGDGLDDQNDNNCNNAFLRGYSETLNDLATKLKDRYTAFSVNAEDSSDIISFLFKYDNDYGFSNYVKRSPLMTLLLIHASAVAYYIGLILKKDNLEVPQQLGFTGMGSKYLNIISPNPSDIAELFKSVLDYMGLDKDEISKLKVILTDKPKVVTARGGVAFHLREKKLQQVESIVYGYDCESDMDKRLQKKDVAGKQKDVMNLIDDFCDYFSSDQFNDMKSKLNRGWDFQPIDKSNFMTIAEASFRSWLNQNRTGSMNDIQQDPLFFWPLKNLFYRYGLDIISK